MPCLVVLLFMLSFLYPSFYFFQLSGENFHKLQECPPTYFQCDNGKCIKYTFRCDNFDDCFDGSDEINCYVDYDYDESSYKSKCNKNEFQCEINKACIPLTKFCDLTTDCLDGSDEYDNCVEHLNCSDRFRCSDGHCVFNEWVCDGSNDCPDGSDEWNCSANKTSSASNCKTEKSQYLCGNQRCIALNSVCDKKDDCGDNSDEGVGCIPSSCPSAGCDHDCKQTPKGSVCVCKPGYELQNNNRTCKDVDECQTYGICDQICVNSPGSYSCACQKDYFLSNDNKTCKAQAGEAMMVFSVKNEIIGIYVDSRIIFPLASNLYRAVGVATNGDNLYWSDIEEGRETIAKKNGYNYEVIVTTGLSMISGLAVDWITENIYFTDEDYNRIGVCNNDGTNCTILISGLNKPTGIALLPTRGKMYWGDGGSNARIAVAGMDGKNIHTFVSTNLGWPRSVTIDYPNDRLYWVDFKLQIVESIRLDGTDRRLVLHDIIHEPISLAVFENTLYWSDWGSNTIQSCNKFSGKDWRILHRTRNKPYNIHIDHSAIKPKIDNPCKFNPCSQLCMLNEDKGYTCACNLGEELNADKHTCQEIKKKQHLLIITRKAFINYYHDMLRKPKITNSSLVLIKDVISDPLTGKVIICKEGLTGMDIIRYDPVNNTFENITKTSLFVEGIAFDHITNNLYMSNILKRSIEVYNIRTMAKTVFYFQDVPYSITLVPEESKMFVVLRKPGKTLFWYEKEDNMYSIYEMRMDGLGERRLFRKNLEGQKISMYYDRDSKTLFVSDEKSGNILSHSNKDTRILRTGLQSPLSLAVAGDNIFWTEFNSAVLYWTNFKSISSNHKAIAFRIPENLSAKYDNSIVVTLRKDAKQEHDCQKNNGNCSHVCLLSSITSFTCACPPGMELSDDNRTCIAQHECSNNEYKCSEHNLCIKKEQLCDGIRHCPNGEDETKDCEEKGRHCKEDQFMCKNSDCISLKDRCNMHFDCTDQSDEENCDKPECRNDEFQCNDGTCIPNTQVCNHFPDCSDSSDELFINCVLRTCPPNNFMCNDRKCIPNGFLCDGEYDCFDGADEAPEKCKPHGNAINPVCEHFQCTNGDCISSSLRCDGIADCIDDSDEKNCSKTNLVNCTANEYHCFNTDICLPQTVRCDSSNDCPEHDDEHDCAFCFDDEFTCDNMKCIPEDWVCDKINDCGDLSDEKNCDGNKKTVDKYFECKEFECSVGSCLPYSKVCDGIRDCPDGSDENGKCQIACTVNNFCKGVCYKTPRGAVCGCQDGYRLAADAISCEDINECEQDICTQICWNTMGSYECSCYDGYIIRNDKVSCKVIGPPMKFITVTGNDIRKISSNLHSVEMIHSLSDSSVSGLDVNAIHGSIYWSNDAFGTIKKMNIKTKNITTIMIVEHPQALAVDWITDNVYVIDNNRPNNIKVCDLEKERCATLVKIEDKAKAMSLVVDPINKWLFWTQITWQMDQPFSKIYRTDMMGIDKAIISSHEGFVTGMAIDHIKSKLYWADSFQKTIESSNLDGNQRSTFLNIDKYHSLGNIRQAVYISIYEESLYWFMGFNGGKMEYCKLYGQLKSCETLYLGKNNIRSHFTILHTSRQPFGENPCDEKYCDYMCVLKKDNATCICSDGKPIKSNSVCTINTNELKSATRNPNSSRNTRNINGIYSIVIIVLLIGVLLLCIYYYYQRNKLQLKSASNFKCSSIRFQNPSYDRRDEVEVMLDSAATDLAPGQHEYVNPIDDKFLKIAKECSAQKSNQYSERKNVEENENKALIYFPNTK